MNSDKESLQIAFIGDVMLGRSVNEEIPQHPPEWFWGNTLPILQSADGVIANLECAVTTTTKRWMRTPKVYHFQAAPKAIEVLHRANIRCVSLANNHSLDYEIQGLLDTLSYLDNGGIVHAGAGKNQAEAERPAVVTIKNQKIGFIALTDNEPPFAAQADRPGTNYLEINTEPDTLGRLEKAIATLKEDGASLVVMSLHWGPNMAQSPPRHFRDFAHAAIDRGVHLIHGHSAHIFQGVEVYRSGLILYDTGDFIDDYAVDPLLRNDWSFIFLVEMEFGRIHRLRLIPVRLEYTRTNLAIGKEFDVIRGRMRRLCSEFHTPLIDTPEGLVLFLNNRQMTDAKEVQYG